MHLEVMSKQANKFHQLLPSPSLQDLESLAAEWELPSRWSLRVFKKSSLSGWGVFQHAPFLREQVFSGMVHLVGNTGLVEHQRDKALNLAELVRWCKHPKEQLWILDQTSTLPSISSYWHQRKMTQCRSQSENETSEVLLISLGVVVNRQKTIVGSSTNATHRFSSWREW